MIVLQINIVCVRVFETKRYPQVSRDVDRPRFLASPSTGEASMPEGSYRSLHSPHRERQADVWFGFCVALRYLEDRQTRRTSWVLYDGSFRSRAKCNATGYKPQTSPTQSLLDHVELV